MAFESSKIKSIKKALKRHGGSRIKFVKFHGSEFTEAGTPDIIGCYRRIGFVLECKNERGKLSAIQEVRLREWKAAGAEIGVPRSGEDALKVLKRIDDYQDHSEALRARHPRANRLGVQGTRSRDTRRKVAKSARRVALSDDNIHRAANRRVIR